MQQDVIMDWARFSQTRQQLGSNFLRALGYLREDGARAVGVIEQAMRDRNAIALIAPADTIKTDALQMGALSLAELAEDIEFGARDCIELRQAPDLLIEPVMQLRAVYQETVTQIESQINPLLQRRFG